MAVLPMSPRAGLADPVLVVMAGAVLIVWDLCLMLYLGWGKDEVCRQLDQPDDRAFVYGVRIGYHGRRRGRVPSDANGRGRARGHGRHRDDTSGRGSDGDGVGGDCLRTRRYSM